jgi:hypothetical protein
MSSGSRGRGSISRNWRRRRGSSIAGCILFLFLVPFVLFLLLVAALSAAAAMITTATATTTAMVSTALLLLVALMSFRGTFIILVISLAPAVAVVAIQSSRRRGHAVLRRGWRR